MSYQAEFYGDLVPVSQVAESYHFEILDIYLPQKSKWLKEDSFAASKLFTNMELLKAAKRFVLGTTSGSAGRTFKDVAASNKVFHVRIAAFVAKYMLEVLCYDCELMQALLAPTPTGTAQAYEIKFSDAVIKQIASSGGSGRKLNSLGPSWRGPVPVIGVGPWGHGYDY